MTQPQNSSLSPALPKRAFVFGLVAAFIGMALSVYLAVQHTRLKSGIQEGASFCSLGKYADCDVVWASPYSEVMGVSIASLGAVFYALTFLLLLVGSFSKPETRFTARIVAWLAFVALLIDVGLGFIQVAIIHSLCLLCVLTYVCTFVVFVVACLLQTGKKTKFAELVREGLFVPLAGPRPSWAALSLVTIATLTFAAFLWMLPEYLRMNLRTSSMDGFFNTWKERTPSRIPVHSGDIAFGPEDAKVQIVEFSDFECPHCKRAAFALHTFLKTKGDRVQFVFKNFPLDNACNGLLDRPMHKNACALARLSRCANTKGKFKEFHDKVFFELSDQLAAGGSQTLLDSVRKGVLSSVFSEEEFHSCLSDSGTAQPIQDDIRQGVELGVKGTPALYINGNPVPIQITLENLNRFYEIESRR